MTNENPETPADSPDEQPAVDCPHAQHRRSFFAMITVGFSAVIGALMTVPVLGFVLAPVFQKSRKVWRDVGAVADYQENETKLVSYEDPSPEKWAGVTAKSGAWVRRESETQFVAFSINCRHLGCPVRWVDGAGLFMCPCHGGVYYKDGTVAGGPPPEPLHRMDIRVVEGRIEIQTGPIPLTIFSKSMS